MAEDKKPNPPIPFVLSNLGQNQFETMRDRAESVERELRRRDVADALATIEKRKAAEAAAAAANEAEAVAARDASLEKTRRSCWLNWRVDRALEAGGDAFAKLLGNTRLLNEAPERGWPPGTSAADYGAVPVLTEPADFSNTFLGQCIAQTARR